MEYTYVIIALEIMSIVITAILFYGNSYEKRKNKDISPKKKTAYSIMLITNAVGVLADMFSWILNGNVEYSILISTFTIISMIDTYILIAEFSFYLYSILFEKGKVNKYPFMFFGYSCIVAIVVTICMFYTGKLFVVVDGVYREAELYIVYLIFTFLFIAASAALATLHRKLLGRHDTAAVYLYILVPVLCTIISTVIPQLSLGYVSTTIALLIVYVMLQYDTTSKLVVEKNENIFIAKHDELTGLLARRAYTEKLDELETTKAENNEDNNIGVVFADVNGLKYVNDRFGHSAGDNLLVKFANIARGCFREEEIYRISGDEFVVLLPGISERSLKKRVEDFKSKLNVDNKIVASCGCEYGNTRHITELIRRAEEYMYDEKEKYYLEHPETKR